MYVCINLTNLVPYIQEESVGRILYFSWVANFRETSINLPIGSGTNGKLNESPSRSFEYSFIPWWAKTKIIWPRFQWMSIKLGEKRKFHESSYQAAYDCEFQPNKCWIFTGQGPNFDTLIVGWHSWWPLMTISLEGMWGSVAAYKIP